MLALGPEPEFRRAFDDECARIGARLLFDVGANFGYYSLVFVGSDATRRAIAIEPQGDNLELLHRNARLRPGLTVEAAVASSVAGRVAFSPDATTGHKGHVTHAGEGSVTVRSVTLDGLAEIHGAPDIVKVDVEGHELEVLRGAGQILVSRPVVFVECFHGIDGPCVGLLRTMGYSVLDAEDPARGSATSRTTNFLAR